MRLSMYFVVSGRNCRESGLQRKKAFQEIDKNLFVPSLSLRYARMCMRCLVFISRKRAIKPSTVLLTAQRNTDCVGIS